MPLTNAYLPKLANRLFNGVNSYGLGETAAVEISASSYASRSGTLFGWTTDETTPSAPFASNTNPVYYPELTTGESYTANYFLVFSSALGSRQLVYSAAFQSPAASVSAGEQVKIAAYVSGAQRGVKVIFTL